MLQPFVGETGRVIITNDEIDGPCVVILPSRCRDSSGSLYAAGALWFPAIMLVGLTIGPRVKRPPLENVVGLIFCACGAAINLVFWIFLFHWHRRGREILRTDGRSLMVRREARFIHQSRSFALSEIDDIRHDPPEPPRDHAPYWGEFGRGGSIAFESSGKTFRFGRELTPGDGDRIIAWVTAAKSTIG